MVTQISSPSLPTDALERVNQIDACSTIQARTSSAVVDILVAMHPGVTSIANTPSASTFASASTRRTFATTARFFIHNAKLWIVSCWLGAVFPLPLFGTVTVVIRLRVEAGCGISAWIRTAVISVDLALESGETNWANALVRVHQVSTFSAVLTGFRGTFIDIHVAIFARISCGAAAMVVVDQVDA